MRSSLCKRAFTQLWDVCFQFVLWPFGLECPNDREYTNGRIRAERQISKGYKTSVLSDTEYCRTLCGILSYHLFTSFNWASSLCMPLFTQLRERQSLDSWKSKWLIVCVFICCQLSEIYSPPFWRISFCRNPFWKNVLRVNLFFHLTTYEH